MSRAQSEKIPARDRIISTAFELFHLQGVNATGIDEILQKSGTGKGQFYYYFKNKDDLVHCVLEYVYEHLTAGGWGEVYAIDSLKDLKNWFEMAIAMQTENKMDRSCPVATIGVDITSSQKQLRQDTKKIFDFLRSQMSGFFAEMKAQGKIAKSHDPDKLANFCITSMQGGLLMSKVHRDTQMFEDTAEHAYRYIKSIVR